MRVGAPGEAGFQILSGKRSESLGWAGGYRWQSAATGWTGNVALVRAERKPTPRPTLPVGRWAVTDPSLSFHSGRRSDRYRV